MKTVLAQLRQYKKDSLLTMGFTMLEVIMEVLLPFVTAMIIDEGLERSDLSAVARLGVIMLVMAAVSLISGAMDSYIENFSKSIWMLGQRAQ